MKTVVKLLIPGCLILFGCKEQTQSNKVESDLNSEYVTIDIYTPSGWSLTIKHDGSGEVGFGSDTTDFATFEQNTFIFSDVMEKLKSKLEPEGSISEQIAVNLWDEDETSLNVFYTSDRNIINKFFEKALSAITVNKERIEKIYNEKKPLSIE